MLPTVIILMLKLGPSVCQMQEMVPVVQGPRDGSGLLGSTTRWDVGSCRHRTRRGGGHGGRRQPRHLILTPALPSRGGHLIGAVCGGSRVGWGQRPDSKHSQTSRPFSSSFGSWA